MRISKVLGSGGAALLVTSLLLCLLLYSSLIAALFALLSHTSVDNPSVLAKSPNGTFPLWSLIAFFPFLFFARVYIHMKRIKRKGREAPYSEITDGFFVGGWPDSPEENFQILILIFFSLYLHHLVLEEEGENGRKLARIFFLLWPEIRRRIEKKLGFFLSPASSRRKKEEVESAVGGEGRRILAGARRGSPSHSPAMASKKRGGKNWSFSPLPCWVSR